MFAKVVAEVMVVLAGCRHRKRQLRLLGTDPLYHRDTKHCDSYSYVVYVPVAMERCAKNFLASLYQF